MSFKKIAESRAGIAFLSIILLTLLILPMLNGCFLLDENAGEANCVAGEVTLKYNYVQDYYVLEAKITNKGDADATGVTVYYYYSDLYSMKDYSKSSYVGTIKAGESVTFTSSKIYTSSYGSEIVKYGISDIDWS